MFQVDGTIISITRGDIGTVEVSATGPDGEAYSFQQGDVVRFKVMQKKRCDVVVLQKDISVEHESASVDIPLTSQETRIGSIINKPIDYWYEVELNSETEAQTIIGYDEDGPKIFRLYPEGDIKV